MLRNNYDPKITASKALCKPVGALSTEIRQHALYDTRTQYNVISTYVQSWNVKDGATNSPSGGLSVWQS